MMELFLAIAFSACIFVLFKLFPNYQIDTFQAIVVNYFVAFTCGIIYEPFEWGHILSMNSMHLSFLILSALLFIGLFLLMGLSAQKNGISSTSISVKMSMALSALGMVLFYAEAINFLKIVGIICAVLGVLAMSIQKDGKEKNVHAATWMLLILFVGSGLLDFLLNYIQQRIISENETAFFTAGSFGMAGIIGMMIAIFLYMKGKLNFHVKNIFAGIALGIPNFFSIFFLLKSYLVLPWNASSILSIINVSIVMISSIVGYFIFREKWSLLKFVGFVFSVISILFLYLSV